MDGRKILITGSSGLVGSRYIELYPDKKLLLLPDEKEFDITDINSIKDYLNKHSFGTLVNFAAYTDVAEAEKQRANKNGICWKINVDGVRNLVNVINSENIHFIHISTDMVFPGSYDDPGPYSEDHKPETVSDRVTWYGYTKSEGERIILDNFGAKSTILRLIYPVRTKYDSKLDYLRKPLKLYDEAKLYPMFTDQQISISFIDEIAEALNKIIAGGIYGIFHASSIDTTTPYEIVSYLIKKARGAENKVVPASLDYFLKTVDNPIRYPKYGGLRVENTQRDLGVKFSSWRQIVDTLVKQGIGVQ